MTDVKWTKITGYAASMPSIDTQMVMVAGKKISGDWDLSIIRVATMNESWIGCSWRHLTADDYPPEDADEQT